MFLLLLKGQKQHLTHNYHRDRNRQH